MSRVFSSVLPNYFEISFYGKTLQNFHFNKKFMVLCLKNVLPKNNIIKNVSPTKKKVENHWFKQYKISLGIDIHAEVVTFVAGSLEAGGLPGSLEIPEVLK